MNEEIDGRLRIAYVSWYIKCTIYLLYQYGFEHTAYTWYEFLANLKCISQMLAHSKHAIHITIININVLYEIIFIKMYEKANREWFN